MGAGYAIVPFDFPTGTGGTLDITSAGLGSAANMKAAILVVSGATALDTVHADARLTIGVTDGTNHETVSGNDDDGTPGASANRSQSSVFVLQGTRDGGVTDFDATFNSWILDGIRINITNGAEAVFKGFAILFNGTDISAKVGSFFNDGSAIGATRTVATVGFTSDVIFGFTADDDAGGANYSLCQGVVDFTNSVITQGCIARFVADGSDPVVMAGRHANNRFLGAVNGSGNLGAMEITTVNASGFIATTRDVADAIGPCVYLCLAFNGVKKHWVGTVTSPTLIGSDSVTAPGFKPDFDYQLPSLIHTPNTTVTNDESDAGGIGANNGSTELCASVVGDDGATPNSSTASEIDSKSIHLLDAAQADELVAAHVSYDALGYTKNWSVVDAVNNDQIVALALGPARVPDFMPFFNSPG